MQFQVPQFIEVEDKIFGPFTFKQFLYVAGAAGISFVFWRTLPIIFAAPLIAVVGGFGAALAFMQMNGRPFILVLESGFFYLVRGKLYLWDHARPVEKKKEAASRPIDPNLVVPKLADSKLRDLAWSLDIKERVGESESRSDSEDTNSSDIPGLKTSQDALVR